jgi:hypothetical protein
MKSGLSAVVLGQRRTEFHSFSPLGRRRGSETPRPPHFLSRRTRPRFSPEVEQQNSSYGLGSRANARSTYASSPVIGFTAPLAGNTLADSAASSTRR